MASVNIPKVDTSLTFTEYQQQSSRLRGRSLRIPAIKQITDTLPTDLLRYDESFREHVNARILYEENGMISIIYVAETLEEIQATFSKLISG